MILKATFISRETLRSFDQFTTLTYVPMDKFCPCFIFVVDFRFLDNLLQADESGRRYRQLKDIEFNDNRNNIRDITLAFDLDLFRLTHFTKQSYPFKTVGQNLLNY